MTNKAKKKEMKTAVKTIVQASDSVIKLLGKAKVADALRTLLRFNPVPIPAVEEELTWKIVVDGSKRNIYTATAISAVAV